MNPFPGQPVAAASEASVRQYLISVFNLMAMGLVLSGGIAYAAVSSGLYLKLLGTPLIFVVMLSPLALVFFLGARVQHMSVAAAQATYWAFVSLMGLSLGWVFLRYTGESMERVFFITAGTFGAMSLYGYTTRADLSSWGSFLFMGLVGLIIASVANIFFQSSAASWVISVIGVLVFTGYTAYDVNKLKAFASAYGTEGDVAQKGAIMGALNLYLDFVNLFLFLLRLLGDRR